MEIKLMLLKLIDNQFQLKIKSECTANDFNKSVLEFELTYYKFRHKLIINPISKLHFTQSELDVLKSIINGDNKELFNSLNGIANDTFNYNDSDHSEFYYMICDYNDDIRYVN